MGDHLSPKVEYVVKNDWETSSQIWQLPFCLPSSLTGTLSALVRSLWMQNEPMEIHKAMFTSSRFWNLSKCDTQNEGSSAERVPVNVKVNNKETTIYCHLNIWVLFMGTHHLIHDHYSLPRWVVSETGSRMYGKPLKRLCQNSFLWELLDMSRYSKKPTFHIPPGETVAVIKIMGIFLKCPHLTINLLFTDIPLPGRGSRLSKPCLWFGTKHSDLPRNLLLWAGGGVKSCLSKRFLGRSGHSYIAYPKHLLPIPPHSFLQSRLLGTSGHSLLNSGKKRPPSWFCNLCTTSRMLSILRGYCYEGSRKWIFHSQ